MDVIRYIVTILSIGIVLFELIEAGRYARAPPTCPKLTGFNGRIKYRRRGTRAVFKCAKSENRYGPRYLTCQRDGTWNGEMPVCIKSGCVPVDVSQSPYLDMAEQFSGALLKFSCEASYQLLGATESYCDGHNWSNPLPTCKATTDLTECDFETDHCGWTQDDTDEGDWVRNAGPTSTGNTGPKYDHTFEDKAAGHYLFFEASNPATNGDQARLVSPEYTADMSPMCFDFWYHLLGPDDQGHVGSLEVFVLGRSQFFDDLQPVFYKEGNQGDRWIRGEIIIDEMTEPYQIVIEATRKLSYISDIAIDDLRLFNCTDDTTTTVTTTSATVKTSMQPKPNTTVTKTTLGNTTSPFANITASPAATTRFVNKTTVKVQPTTSTERSLTNTSKHTTSTTLAPKPTTTNSTTNTTVSKTPTTVRPVPSTTGAPASTKAKTTLKVTNTTTLAPSTTPTTPTTKPSTVSSTSAPTTKPPATATTTVAVTSRPTSPTTASATTTQTTRKPPTTANPTTTTTQTTTVTKRTKASTPKPTKPTLKPTKPKTTPTTTQSTTTRQTTTVPTITTPVYTESTTKQTTLRPDRTTQMIARTTASATEPTKKAMTERFTTKRTSTAIPPAPTISSQTKTPSVASKTASTTQYTNLSTKSTQATVSVGVMKASEHPKDDTLKPLMIGLGVGIVAGLIIIGVVAYVCIRRRKFYTSRYEDELKPITNSGSSQSINNVQYYDGDEEYES